MESFRNQDMRAEQQLSEFMDSYFYSRLHEKDGKPLHFERIRDPQLQLQGIDVCFEIDGKKWFVDEKASLYYSNAMIPTFAFEIDSLQKGHSNPVEGWFINDALKTQYYMLIWPNVKCEKKGKQWVRKNISELTKYDFTIVEAMLIKKDDITIQLKKYGYDKKYFIDYAKGIRSLYGKENCKNEEDLCDNAKIVFSKHLAEQPINLVIRKELLKKLAKAIYLISADGYATIKG